MLKESIAISIIKKKRLFEIKENELSRRIKDSKPIVTERGALSDFFSTGPISKGHHQNIYKLRHLRALEDERIKKESGQTNDNEEDNMSAARKATLKAIGYTGFIPRIRI